jgi:hypothetical protein
MGGRSAKHPRIVQRCTIDGEIMATPPPRRKNSSGIELRRGLANLASSGKMETVGNLVNHGNGG